MANFTIKAVRGDTITLDFTVKRPAGGAAVDLTGATFTFTAKKKLSDADAAALFQKTLGSGVSVTNAANGQGRVTVAPADTTSLPDYETDLYCDLQMTEAVGTVTTVAEGILRIRPDVTEG